MTIHDLSEKLANHLSEITGDPKKAPILTYGLELIIGESVKIIALILTAYIFGLLIPVLLILCTSVPLRILTGGQHCSSSFRCLIGTIIIIPILAFSARLISTGMTQVQLLVFIFIESILFIGVLVKYGPGYSVNYPNPSTQILSKVKKHALIFLGSWLVVILLLCYFVDSNKLNALIITSTSVGVLWQGFLITPLGHRFITTMDKYLLLLKKGCLGGVKNVKKI